MTSTVVPVDTLVAVVAHRALLDERLPSYLALLTETGFVVQQQTHLILSAQHVPLLLNQGVEDDTAAFAVDLPACVLLLQRVDAYAAFDALREQLDFVYGSRTRWLALRDRQAFFPVRPTLERALLVMQPGYTQDDYATVLDALEQQQFVVVGKTGKILTAAEAELLVGEDKAAIAALTSDVSLFLALQRLNANTALTLLVGPPDAQAARKVAPTSLRARLSSPLYQSGSEERAAQDIKLAFGAGGFALERTVAVLGGAARDEEQEADIMRRLRAEGFTIVCNDELYINRARGQRLLRGRDGQDDTTAAWSAAPCLALVLTKPAAVRHWQVLASQLPCTQHVYSSRAEDVEADIRELFPLLPAVAPLSEAEVLARFASSNLQPVLTSALIALCKAKPAAADAVTWLAHWLLANNPNQPNVATPTDPGAEPAVATPLLSHPATSGAAGVTPALHMVWLMSRGDDAAEAALVAGLVKVYGFVQVDVTAVLAAAVRNDSLRGLAIAEHAAMGRALPAQLLLPVLVPRLTAAAADGGSSRVLLTHGPANLDQAIALEQAVGDVTAVLAVRPAGGDGKRDKDAASDDELQTVQEHYRVFGKLHDLDASSDVSTWPAGLRRLLQP